MMDARIILAGQQPDVMGAFSQGLQVRGQQNALMDQNALRSLYAEQGPGLVAGDPGAVNALARLDPGAAMGVQDAKVRRDVLTAQERRAAAEYARGLSAEQAAAEAAKIEEGVRMGMAARSPQEWDAMMAQLAPDMVGMFDQRQMLAARYMSMAEVLKGQEGPQYRPATPEEAARYGSMSGQINTATGQFTPINPPSTMSLTTGPNGETVFTQGPAGTGKPFTEAQSKDNVFATRAEGALSAFEPVADALVSRTDRIADMVPMGLARGIQSDEFQLAKQAGDEFLQAILRKDTGAAITQPEQELYGVTYLPQPGDGAAVLAAKREARVRAVEALKSGMDPRQIAVSEQARINAIRRAEAMGSGQGASAPEAPQVNAPAQAPGAPPPTFLSNPAVTRAAEGAGVSPEQLWQFLSDEDKAQFSQ